jgi:hypothetical protein
MVEVDPQTPLTATIAMSPSESEIHEEAAMLARARASGLEV